MTELSDEQVDELLRDAEKRLLLAGPVTPAQADLGTRSLRTRTAPLAPLPVGDNSQNAAQPKGELQVRSVAVRCVSKAPKVHIRAISSPRQSYPDDEVLTTARGN